jgi:hypothetical protein
MDLPNRNRAYVPREKLTNYLLSETHPVGKSKAKFFRALGFDDSQVGQLEQELLAIAHSQQVDEEEATPHGVKYAIEGPLHTPGGNVVRIRTVWIVEGNETNPRFVTAYPA